MVDCRIWMGATEANFEKARATCREAIAESAIDPTIVILLVRG
jgi:hypothetical protein